MMEFIFQYMSLMAELGEGPPPKSQATTTPPNPPLRQETRFQAPLTHPPPNPMVNCIMLSYFSASVSNVNTFIVRRFSESSSNTDDLSFVIILKL